MNWVYLPPWGMTAVVAVAAGLAVCLLLRVLRERRMVRLWRHVAVVVLRLLAIAGLLFVALNPTELPKKKVRTKPRLTVLLDTSASMATEDVRGKTRLAAALDELRQGMASVKLPEAFVLDVRTFDRASRAALLGDLKPDDAVGKATDIGGALDAAVADLAGVENHAGILLVSDGRATAAGSNEAAQVALARNVPIWAWCLGDKVSRRDLWIDMAATEVMAFAGDQVELVAAVGHLGYAGHHVRVEVLRGKQPVRTVPVLLDSTGSSRVAVTVTAPDEGEHRYTFRVPKVDPKEESTDNNERAVFLRVISGKIKVLLAEGQPHWDTKFLVQCLKRDEHVALTAVYRIGPRRFYSVVSAEGQDGRREADLFPRTARDMNAYDVIVLGRGCEHFLDQSGQTGELLTGFVATRGGGLIFARGQPYTGTCEPLAKLEPVAWGRGIQSPVRPRLTPEGFASPVLQFGPDTSLDDIAERLPALDQAMVTRGARGLAVVLATTGSASPTSPGNVVMAYQRYGQGKVLTLNAGGLWRWAFREKGREEDETVYQRFWLSLLRWVVAGSDYLPGATVALRTDRRYYTDEQPIRFLITTRGIEAEAYRPVLAVEGGAVKEELTPAPAEGGGYTAETGPFVPGRYRVALHSNVGEPKELTMAIDVVSASVENRDLSAAPYAMKRLADLSGGRFLATHEVADLPRLFERWTAEREIAAQRKPLWDHWELLAVILIALAMEWGLRRWEGVI